jgi:hypothetical protein
VSWEALAQMPQDEVREKGLYPAGFMPLPHANHPEGGMIFPCSGLPSSGSGRARPFMHDGRLLTLDAVEFSNLIPAVQLTRQEKKDLVAFLRAL